MSGTPQVSGTGQIVALAVACLLVAIGSATMFDLGRMAQRLARLNRWLGSYVPTWIRDGPTTFSLDAAGMRVFGGGIVAVGLLYLWFAVDAVANSSGAYLVVFLLAGGMAVLALSNLMRR